MPEQDSGAKQNPWPAIKVMKGSVVTVVEGGVEEWKNLKAALECLSKCRHLVVWTLHLLSFLLFLDFPWQSLIPLFQSHSSPFFQFCPTDLGLRSCCTFAYILLASIF